MALRKYAHQEYNEQLSEINSGFIFAKRLMSPNKLEIGNSIIFPNIQLYCETDFKTGLFKTRQKLNSWKRSFKMFASDTCLKINMSLPEVARFPAQEDMFRKSSMCFSALPSFYEMELDGGVNIRSAFAILNHSQYNKCGINFSQIGENIMFSLVNESTKFEKPEVFMNILN